MSSMKNQDKITFHIISHHLTDGADLMLPKWCFFFKTVIHPQMLLFVQGFVSGHLVTFNFRNLRIGPLSGTATSFSFETWAGFFRIGTLKIS